MMMPQYEKKHIVHSIKKFIKNKAAKKGGATLFQLPVARDIHLYDYKTSLVHHYIKNFYTYHDTPLHDAPLLLTEKIFTLTDVVKTASKEKKDRNGLTSLDIVVKDGKVDSMASQQDNNHTLPQEKEGNILVLNNSLNTTAAYTSEQEVSLKKKIKNELDAILDRLIPDDEESMASVSKEQVELPKNKPLFLTEEIKKPLVLEDNVIQLTHVIRKPQEARLSEATPLLLTQPLEENPLLSSQTPLLLDDKLTPLEDTLTPLHDEIFSAKVHPEAPLMLQDSVVVLTEPVGKEQEQAVSSASPKRQNLRGKVQELVRKLSTSEDGEESQDHAPHFILEPPVMEAKKEKEGEKEDVTQEEESHATFRSPEDILGEKYQEQKSWTSDVAQEISTSSPEPYKGHVKKRVLERSFAKLSEINQVNEKEFFQEDIHKDEVALSNKIEKSIQDINHHLKQKYAAEQAQRVTPLRMQIATSNETVSSLEKIEKELISKEQEPQLALEPPLKIEEKQKQSAEVNQHVHSAPEETIQEHAVGMPDVVSMDDVVPIIEDQNYKEVAFTGQKPPLMKVDSKPEEDTSNTLTANKEAHVRATQPKNVPHSDSESVNSHNIVETVKETLLSDPTLRGSQRTILRTIASLLKDFGSALANVTAPKKRDIDHPSREKESLSSLSSLAYAKKHHLRPLSKTMLDNNNDSYDHDDDHDYDYDDHDSHSEEDFDTHEDRHRHPLHRLSSHANLEDKIAHKIEGKLSLLKRAQRQAKIKLTDPSAGESHATEHAVLENMVFRALKPMVDSWLEQNLERIVSESVEKQIKNIMRHAEKL